jgi:hypothetical protein
VSKGRILEVEVVEGEDKAVTDVSEGKEEVARVWYERSPMVVRVVGLVTADVTDELRLVDGVWQGLMVFKGTTLWLRDGVPHREDDLPSHDVVIHEFREQTWYRHGVKHRGGGLPAHVVTEGGLLKLCEWYTDGKLDRAGDMPARVSDFGAQLEWWRDGELHRDNDLPALLEAENVFGRLGRHFEGLAGPAVTDYANVGSASWCETWEVLAAVVADCGGVIREWHVRNKRHRGGGKPAIVCERTGSLWWLEDGKFVKFVKGTKSGDLISYVDGITREWSLNWNFLTRLEGLPDPYGCWSARTS